MRIITHTGAIEGSFTEEQYTASCSCGWFGPVQDTREAAESDLTKHYQDVVTP